LRCFGLRIDAQRGTGTFKALALSSSLLTMSGSGSVNLGEETLAMALQPRARVAGTNLVIPVNVTGPIRNPAVSVNRVGTAESNAGTVAGAVIGNATPLGIVGGLLGDKLLGGATPDICAPALAAARGQPVPEAARPGVSNAPAPGTPSPKAPGPDAILKNLFR
jgi:AsmA protein